MPTGLSGMSDMELIMQLARLEGEEEAQTNRHSDEGNNFEGAETAQSNGEKSEFGEVEATPMKGSVPLSASQPLAASGNQELQALADLEKELGLDDLQLYLDSTTNAASATKKPATFQSPEASKSNVSNGTENGTSAHLTTPTSSKVNQKSNEDDDDNLDELEKYLESLSAPSPPN